ncbi:MAG: AAA family ATPase [Planctomycetota bacterium]
MFRQASKDIEQWAAAPKRRPLLLRGARQTGKSWLVSNLRVGGLGDVAVVNLERDPGLATAFGSTHPAKVVAELETHLRRPIQPGRTVLFLDEIQQAPALLAKLRWFHEEMPALHVVAAGSLLDFALASHEFSMPVGRVTYGHLEPMTFAEFLDAVGEERLRVAIQAATPQSPLSPALHDRASTLHRDYLLVGGMPAAVAEWVESRSFARVTTRHRDVLASTRDDFAKYRRRIDPSRIEKVFAALPRLVGRKFQPTQVDRDERSQALKEAFRMLTMARIVTPVRRTAANAIPLGAEVDERYEKVCLLDVGLFATMSGLDAASLPADPDLRFANHGQLAEQFVGQELRACRPFDQEPALFTWVREAKNSNAELDYVIQVGALVVPVEVKAGAPGTLRSLHVMVAETGLDLGVRVGPGPLQVVETSAAATAGPKRPFRLLSVPFAMVSEIPRLVRALG